ncbi:Tyrosine--tRNA ligase [Candidatus Bealeia paramacronuclearis]|uniref:Tyrosine--tRNA ligase n=1 Tax=Candidatus Bealeia paramacronuclearis TaxID=1921001 RepID=A0ABZ2C3I9_9PROT|nr:Tyrosine--tRNA ligase [Candidatus Bealeia paramacronuclearis]
MTSYKSPFLQEINARGFINQVTHPHELDEALLNNKPIIGYIGFDATADSLHVGSFVQIMLLHWMQKMGHKPIVILGGGTTKIGDPSDKDEMRKMLDEESIQKNITGISKIFHRLLKVGDGPTDAVILNNDDWLKNIKYLEFLRDYGKHFTINRMISFERVKARLEKELPLTFLEFNYMLIQAYDFLELNQKYNCRLQMGGADQWGNIVSSVDLVRRLGQSEGFGLTTPLITTSSGAKMGKTAQGAVWLNSDKLSAFDFWQFWRNTEDADVGRFLRLFTTLPLEEIARLEKREGAEINESKKMLADETTRLVHGDEAVLEARKTAHDLFESQGSLDHAQLPHIEISLSQITSGFLLIDAFRELGLATSNGEARRLIRGGGARLNDSVLSDENQKLAPSDFEEGLAKLSAGKKRHGVVRRI